MKTSGIVRKIDELGRIVLPIEMRNRLEIGPGVGVEIYFENDAITLRKHQEACAICGETAELSDFKSKKLCKACIAEIKGE